MTWQALTLNSLNSFEQGEFSQEIITRGGFRVQNKVVTNFCKIDAIYIPIIALIFVIIVIIVVVIIIIVNAASGDWSMTI